MEVYPPKAERGPWGKPPQAAPAAPIEQTEQAAPASASEPAAPEPLVGNRKPVPRSYLKSAEAEQVAAYAAMINR
jgi:hypothetical protein